MPRYRFTKEDCRKGRQAQARAEVPDECPRCEKSLVGYSFNRYLGHLGLHGLADNKFKGDIEAAQEHLQRNGLARQDPAPWNGAWRPYVPVEELEF